MKTLSWNRVEGAIGYTLIVGLPSERQPILRLGKELQAKAFLNQPERPYYLRFKRNKF